MDYTDDKEWKGEVQFHPDRKPYMCKHLGELERHVP